MANFIFYPRVTETESGRQNHPGVVDIPCDAGEVSDGYHTFNELYEHRHLLFCAMSRLSFDLAFRGQREALYCWKAHTHWIDGKIEPVWDGWFIAGIEIGGKMITYHLPIEYWNLFNGIEREQAPPHDGHTSQDVIDRLREWLKGGK
jgi:hypothetical protein